MDKEVVSEVLKNGTLIREEDEEYMPERIPDSVVDVFLVRKHFCQNAWLVVEGVLKQKIKNSLGLQCLLP